MSLTKATYAMIDGAPVNVLDFGAIGDGITDDTAAIQSAINYASNNNHAAVYFPAGRYIFTTIYVTYDAALNPGFATTKIGRIVLRGDGKIPGGDFASWSTSPVVGTQLVSTAPTTSAIILSTPAQGTSVSGFPNRQQVIQNMTVVANTTQYAIENNGAPDQSGLEDVAVIQENAAGSGVLWKSSWYTYFKGVVIGVGSGVTSSGTGLAIGSELYAGLYNFVSCSFTGPYANAVDLQASFGSTNFYFQNCGFEAATSVGFLVSAQARNVSLVSCYFEGNGLHDIHVATASGVANFDVADCQFFGGTTAATAPSGAVINLEFVSSADISNCIFFRPHTTLVYNKYDAGGPLGNRTTVRQCTVDVSDATYGGGAFFYCVDSNNQQGIPLLINNQINETSVVILVNPAYLIGSNLNSQTVRALSYGFSSVQNVALSTPSQQDFPQPTLAPVRIYDTTAITCSVQLPVGGISTAATLYLANRPTSTQSLTVIQNGGGTLATLAAGEAVICVGNPNGTTWAAFKTTFFA